MNSMRRNELNRKVCVWLICGGIVVLEDMFDRRQDAYTISMTTLSNNRGSLCLL